MPDTLAQFLRHLNIIVDLGFRAYILLPSEGEEALQVELILL